MCVHTCRHAYLNTCARRYVHTPPIYMCISIYTCIGMYVRMDDVCMYACVYVYVYVYACMHAYIMVSMYVYVRKHVRIMLDVQMRYCTSVPCNISRPPKSE